MKFLIPFLFIYFFCNSSLFSQNQINGFDYVARVNDNANFGQIDFFKKGHEHNSKQQKQANLHAVLFNGDHRNTNKKHCFLIFQRPF